MGGTTWRMADQHPRLENWQTYLRIVHRVSKQAVKVCFGTHGTNLRWIDRHYSWIMNGGRTGTGQSSSFH
jgi:hypothetical protein